jgi:hypothetical protein|tara:strand:- start:867 stop:1358 length:492 start_codon:yes stop_codon:yes gene_type:complete
MKNILSLFTKTFLIFSLISSCSSGGDSDELGPLDFFNLEDAEGVWVMNPLCEDYEFGNTIISLDEELPDSVNVLSDTLSNIYIEAGENIILASINNAGIFNIEPQIFLAQVVLFGSLTDIPTNIQGNGYLNDSIGNMDVIFSFENILQPGTIDSINCSIDLSR